MRGVIITDDHDIVRLGTSIVIKEILPDAIIHQATDLEETIKLLNNKKYEMLLLDINMPGGNNINMIPALLSIQPDLKILVFSSYEENIYALRYLQAGACGYVNKNSAKEELKLAIKGVLEKGRYMSSEVSNLYMETLTTGKSSKVAVNPLNLLSNREMDVAKLLINGLSIAEVSKTMGLKNSTVSTYKTRVFNKLQLENLRDLIEKFRLHDES